MFNLLNVLFAFIIVRIARVIKQKIKLFQTLYIPESIIAGAIALLLGTSALGAIAISLGASPDSYLAGGLFPEEMRQVWSQAPGVFINIVFASLFLGEHIPARCAFPCETVRCGGSPRYRNCRGCALRRPKGYRFA